MTKRDKLRRLKALIIKEFHQIVRDPSSLLISVGLPILLLFLYGFGVSLDLNHLRLGLVLEDTSPEAMSFANSLIGSRYFDLKIAKDRRELEPHIIDGSIRGMVIVPSYFTDFRHRPEEVAPIQVIADGSETNTANFVQNYVRGAYQSWLQGEVISSNLTGLPAVTLQTRYWYNEQLESRNFLIPGSLAIIMTLIGTLLTALVVSREWERGTMEALMATPVGIVELVMAKLISYFILGMVSMTLCVSFSVLVYGVPLRGSILLLALVSAIFLINALGVGLLISTLTKNQFVSAQISIVVGFLPAFILSGFIFEIASMPFLIRMVTYAIPARYFVSCLQTLFLVGNVWSLILFNVAIMLVMASVIYFTISRKTVKRLD
ncbi:MAG: ABC transporter permease subunit [Parachlamydia sp.]|nr:ABC transporter permease subunit [Parachlamydia sp.]